MKCLLILLTTTSLVFSQTAAEWKAKAAALEATGKTKDALAAYEKALQQAPNDTGILVKIAKQYGDFMPSLNGGARQAAAKKCLEFSRKAAAVDPNSSDSRLAVAIALGKNVEFLGNKEKLQASREMKSEADAALRLNPKSDYAYHLIGRWHQEMADIGGATRLLAKVVYGGIPQGSYDEALKAFASARKINPKRLIHQIEYGRTLAMMGRKDEAKKEIQRGLNMPSREADDGESKARGKATMEQL